MIVERSTPSATIDQAAAVRLIGYSFLILFLELALIRYVSAYVRVFGFYLNFVLIAAFLGMGVGLLRARAVRAVRWLAVPALLVLFGAVKFFSNVVVQVPRDPDHYVWGVFFEIAPAVRRVGILPTVTVLFALCALLFVPLGAFVGREFSKFRPLHAYSLNVAGSLLGIVAFGSASMMGTEPVLWFTVAFALWALLAWSDVRYRAALLSAGVASLALIYWTAGPRPEYWSPYYRINPQPGPRGYSISVNGSLHQYIIDMRAHERGDSFVALVRQDYLRPYAYVNAVDTVLVLGAGTGNDVALVLEMDPHWVDAVEIDPTILSLGQAAHFQEPYADPRVHAHVQDARAFLKRTRRRYDVIVLGTLDSQTLLSGMSSLRLDNYVYTLEAMEAARDRLRPGGRLITYHMSGYPYIASKISRLLATAFGADPIVIYQPQFRLFNYTFVAGADLPKVTATPAGQQIDVAIPRDNWPYLYLRKPMIPGHYVSALAGVLLVTAVLVGWGAGRALTAGFDGAMFLMGAGFLLIETKSVSEMSLLFGSTWSVNLLVFSAILFMILVANVFVIQRRPGSAGPWFLGLLAALAVAYFVPVNSLVGLGLITQWILGGATVALPILFSAVIFAVLFQRRAETARALGYNVLGAIVGGVLEYGSMAVGIKALYLVAAAAYVGAWAFTRHRTSVTALAVAPNGT